jgi:hypothetical protein
MALFLIERPVPAGFYPNNPDEAALHSRWATDAYNQVGATWYGAVVAGDRMTGLVAADDEAAIERYCEILGIAPGQIIIRRVDAVLGPAVAMAPSDPRYRPQRR